MKIIHLILIVLLMRLSFQHEQEIFKLNETIKFNQILNIQLNLSNLTFNNNTNNFHEKSPFLNLLLELPLENDCINHNKCNSPIIIYGKINSEPNPNDMIYDVKDDKGSIDSKQNIIKFGFEFTPCQFKIEDIIYLKIIGIYKESPIVIKASYSILSNYNVICPQKNYIYSSYYLQGVATTEIGTYSFGGKNTEKNEVSDKLFLLNKDVEWELIDFSIKSNKPSPRYGALFTYFDNYLILYGGKDEKEKILNDIWILECPNDINNIKSFDYNWIDVGSLIIDGNKPNPKFNPSWEILENLKKIIIFGGSEDFTNEIIFLNLDIISGIVKLINEKNQSPENIKDIPEMNRLINSLWTIKPSSIQSRAGVSITQISNNEILFFGGFDVSNNPMRLTEILNINDLSIDQIIPSATSIYPASRGYHKVLRYGKVLYLFGGEGIDNIIFNDIWKFIITSRQWIKVNMNDNTDEFFLFRSNFHFIKLVNQENPVIFGGKNRNNIITKDIIMLEFDKCLSDYNILSDFLCLPCSEGYQLSQSPSSCIICKEGTYHNTAYDYSNSICDVCPPKTYNNRKGRKSISSCLLCENGYYNPSKGQNECSICPIGDICFPGSSSPSNVTYINSLISDNKSGNSIRENNFPDFVSSNGKIRDNWQVQGIVFSVIALSLFVLIIFILDKILGKKCHRLLISFDFLPITGGITKRLNGGILFLLYLYFNSVLIVTFILRFIYYNELTEVIPIRSSQGIELKSSYKLELGLIGYEDNCIDSNQKIDNQNYKCSNNININFDSLGFFKGSIQCQFTYEKICKISIICEDCTFVNPNNLISFKIKGSSSFIQGYYWKFDLLWGETLTKDKGYSSLEGLLRPNDENLVSNYIFVGDKSASSINIFMTPIFYERKSDYTHLQGYRLSFNSYDRTGVSNSIIYKDEDIGLNIKVSNKYIIISIYL